MSSAERVDVAGLEVLDLGCGLGGPSLELVRTHGAKRVLGLDVEQGVLQGAGQAAAAAGLADRVSFKLVQPGPLPLADRSFDLVFSKDALTEVKDKKEIYAEVLRVLRPGGWFVASDWLQGDRAGSDRFREWVKLALVPFNMASLGETARLLAEVGFVEVEVRSRNAWYQAEARRELARMAGPLWPRLVEARSEAAARRSLAFWRMMIEVLDSGEFCPAHIRARKPL